jgi:hypothetical protein
MMPPPFPVDDEQPLVGMDVYKNRHLTSRSDFGKIFDAAANTMLILRGRKLRHAFDG